MLPNKAGKILPEAPTFMSWRTRKYYIKRCHSVWIIVHNSARFITWGSCWDLHVACIQRASCTAHDRWTPRKIGWYYGASGLLVVLLHVRMRLPPPRSRPVSVGNSSLCVKEQNSAISLLSPRASVDKYLTDASMFMSGWVSSQG